MIYLRSFKNQPQDGKSVIMPKLLKFIQAGRGKTALAAVKALQKIMMSPGRSLGKAVRLTLLSVFNNVRLDSSVRAVAGNKKNTGLLVRSRN